MMTEVADDMPTAKKPRLDDSSTNGLDATTASEHQTGDAAGPSQQSVAEDMFGMQTNSCAESPCLTEGEVANALQELACKVQQA